MQEIEICAIVEERSETAVLGSEHGLCLALKTGTGSWLFDTGQTDIVIDNASKLAIELKERRGIILSHGHYDHTGGLRSVLRGSGPKNIYAHPDIFRTRFNLKKGR